MYTFSPPPPSLSRARARTHTHTHTHVHEQAYVDSNVFTIKHINFLKNGIKTKHKTCGSHESKQINIFINETKIHYIIKYN